MIERTGLRRWAVERRVIYVDVVRDFVGVVSTSFLMVPRAPITTRTVVVLSPHIRSTSISKSMYLVDFSVVLTKVLVSRGIVMLVRRQVRLISCYGPVSVNGHVPQNSDAVIGGDSLGFMFIPLFLHLNAKLFADRPVHVCSCLVVAVDVFSFSQFRTARDQVVNGLVETAYSLHFGSPSGFFRMLCLYQHVGRL